ncbi:zinc finger protein 570-like [Dreissena polymorpha]|uniref:C2H2-type domain-containing protein n=1 Tax=Dreissena polymorpha TaxID=45954 RepID=A0A9D4FM70_DREPO|nr:zinc finger protein 570-like [Dreissena polymorpha]KAH3801355.1 hypothetical protein DPMN_155003 [Dreissena polymorpha]
MATLLGHVMSLVLDKSSKVDNLIPCYRGDDFMADELTPREHISSSTETFATEYVVSMDTDSSVNYDCAWTTSGSGATTEDAYKFSAGVFEISQPITLVAKDSVKPKKTNSFSIDSILGNRTSDTPTVDSASPSWLANACVNYSMQTLNWNTCHVVPDGNYNEPEQDRLYWCHACDELCENETEAARHQREHADNRDHCLLKEPLFSKHGYTSVHQKTSYSKRLKCGLCDKIVTSDFLRRHMRAHHCNKCDVCEVELRRNSNIKKNIRAHSEPMSVSCEKCKSKAGLRRVLTVHNLNVHRQTLCKYCGLKFNNKYACAQHERSHTGRKPYACQVPGCRKTFAQDLQLQLHSKVHF